MEVEFEFKLVLSIKLGRVEERRGELGPHITSDSRLRSLLYTSSATGGGARFSALQS